jgi:membrane carboxypeptidase/penicillin-binding protein
VQTIGIGAPIQPYAAVALGAFEATPFEMASAYIIIANGGLKVPQSCRARAGEPC